MKLKIFNLEKGPMVLTGSKVLELIQDNYTPPIDLLVRESIQNSADAILEDKNFGKIMFKIGEFNKNVLSSSLEKIDSNIKKFFPDEKYDYLSITDSNTCGLLGGAVESENGEPNNLYSLVYDIMNRKSGMISGGSHGIGKSVYYRYGAGICIFYSRTFENGRYINKLAGALIQDETKENCLLGKQTSGIAYFGNVSNNKPEPIYDENEIKEFLSCFGLNMYNGTETGTTVIIPFINKEKMLSNTINDDNGSCYWLSNIEDALNISIQRWYFSRLNNEQFLGKYLKIAINNKKVELNKFFQPLQQLYNGSLSGANKITIIDNKFSDDFLGTFIYKVFKKEELGMLPPDNLPSPKYLTDSSYDVDEKGLLFYLRKPGMVVNYDNSKFGNYVLDDDSFLIGVFILNDNATFHDENIGAYMRKSEEANHKEWNDINEDDFPFLKTKKPFKKICAFITKKLTEEFKQTKAVSLEGGNTVLQKKLGEKLLPPSGFGKGAEPKGNPFSSKSKTKHEKKSSIELMDIDSNGNLHYGMEACLNSNETLIIELNVKVGGKSYSFIEWEKMNFTLPCEITRIDIEEIYLDKKKVNSPQNISLDENFIKRRRKLIDGIDIYKVKGLETIKFNHPYGLKIYNCFNKKITIKVKFIIEPIDNKYLIGFDMLFSEVAI